MIFYDVHATYEHAKGDNHSRISLNLDPRDADYVSDFSKEIRRLNLKLDDGNFPDEKFGARVYKASDHSFRIAIAMENGILPDTVLPFLKQYLMSEYAICTITWTHMEEISLGRLLDLTELARAEGFWHPYDYLYDLSKPGGANAFRFSEDMVTDTGKTLDDMKAYAKERMAPGTLLDELERIYSKDNEKSYHGHPLHYLLTVSDRKTAGLYTRILTEALLTNQRLLSGRINRLYRITDRFRDYDDTKEALEASYGSTWVIELFKSRWEESSYADTHEESIEALQEMVHRYHQNTLFILVRDISDPSVSTALINMLQDEVHFIEIKEKSLNKADAIRYMELLASNDNRTIPEEAVKTLLPARRSFHTADLHEAYKRWNKDALCRFHYRAYLDHEYQISDMEVRKKKSSPYDELQEMIGLNEVKRVVDNILDSAWITKLRRTMRLEAGRQSLHMLFMGNPGCAKTSVARLLAGILYKEGIIEHQIVVECGRADLVGRYVGWTAKGVKELFRRARGGILFIDEAYALVDEPGCYGYEAINTIVQEMENYRDDVIVIFAGYSDKMKEFLDANEGLRSRINFHLNFPDYNADELTAILKLMMEKKKYVTDDVTLRKCHQIFADACRQKEFGNGRFVRNLLEQAELNQAARIMKQTKGKRVSKKRLCTFVASDFDVNLTETFGEEPKRIGFAA